MAATQLNSDGIGEVRRNDFDVTTTGQAVITKLIAGTNVSISSTGVDAGTGDVTVNASATAPSDITALSNATVNSSYPSGAYAFNAITTDGYPVNGSLTGKRNGTTNVQRLQDVASGSTYARYWIDGSTAWSAWSIYLDANDFTAKGQIISSSASNAVGVLTVGSNNQVLTADSTQTLGIKWATPSSTGLTINPQTASYPLVLADAGKDVQMNVATANTLTVPLNSSVAFPIGTQIIVTQIGVGQTTIVATGGVTINVPTGFSLALRAQNSAVTLEKTATDTWFVSGDLTITGVQTVATPSYGDNSTQIANTAYVSTLMKVAALASDATTNSTATLAGITGLDTTVGAGTYYFKYIIRYQSGATTTGVKFSVTHTGTVTSFMYQLTYVDATATASTGAASQNQAAGAAGTVVGAWSARAKATTIGPTISVDTLNADMMAIIEGLMIVTVSGSLQLSHASEVAAASTVKAGTSLILTRTA